MNKHTTRVSAVVGATMALVLAGTAAVAASGPRDRDDVRGFGGPGNAGRLGMESMRGGMDGMRGGMGPGGFWGLASDVERAERTVQTADGLTSVRVEQGVVDSAGASSLSFTLGSGEAVTVAIDEDTQVVAFEEQEFVGNRGWTRTRLAPTAIEPAQITTGAEVVVWSDSEDAADFVASRVAVKPAADTAADTSDAAADADSDASDADVTNDDVGGTDA